MAAGSDNLIGILSGGVIEETMWTITDATLGTILRIYPFLIFLHFSIWIVRYVYGFGRDFDLRKELAYVLLFYLLMFYKPIVSNLLSVVNIIEDTIKKRAGYDQGAYISSLQAFEAGIDGVTNKEQLIARGKALCKKANDEYLSSQRLNNSVGIGSSNTTINLPCQAKTDNEYAAFVMTNGEDGKAVEEDPDVGTYKLLATLMNPTAWWPKLIYFGAQVLTGLIALFVRIFSNALIAIMIMVGPLAFFFGGMPFIGDGILKSWFQSLIYYKCWSITITILDIMMIGWAKELGSEATSAGGITKDVITSFAPAIRPENLYAIVFIALYIAVPVITRTYTRGASAGIYSAITGGASTVLMGGKQAAQTIANIKTGGIGAMAKGMVDKVKNNPLGWGFK